MNKEKLPDAAFGLECAVLRAGHCESIKNGGSNLEDAASRYSSVSLAFMGDSVYGLLVRSRLMRGGDKAVNVFDRKSSALERASYQAGAYHRLKPLLSEAELAVMKRGRNAKTNSRAKNASVVDYRLATGVEALFGYLYINGEIERLIELFNKALEEGE